MRPHLHAAPRSDRSCLRLTWRAAAAGYGTRAVFAGVDQSDPAVQRRMRASVDALLDDYAYFDRAASPTQTWLSELHAFVARAAPADANDDGTVAQANFYLHLDRFLAQHVRPLSLSK